MKKMAKKILMTGIITVFSIGSLYACGTPVEYSVNFDCGEGSDTVISSQMVKANKTITPVDSPVRENYVFDGWYLDQGWTSEWNPKSDKVTSDITLYAGWDKATGDQVVEHVNDKDFSKYRTPGSQEEAYEYESFFLPSVDDAGQPYVGDPMPYYEDGVYYIYYLKESGDSYNHSVYLATTQDFVTYTEYDAPVLEASHSGGQDSWIGTGSVVKVEDKYYFFYTGHGDSANLEYKEKIMVAIGDTPTSFQKVDDWEIVPPTELRQKNDFRDPQAYYDAESETINMTVTASQDGTARILKFSLSKDLASVQYDGIIFTDPVGDFWNLECSDTFQIGNQWYITYSAQDDTLWYAIADGPYGPYGEPQRLDGKLFYAAKHVESEIGSYMIGWARRSESASSTQDVAGWAGNLTVQKIVQQNDGKLTLAPVDSIVQSFSDRRNLEIEQSHCFVSAGSLYSYEKVFHCYESFIITGEFQYTGEGSFGLAFDYSGRSDKKKFITISPKDGEIQLYFNEGTTKIAQTSVTLEPEKQYSFTYIQEGSVGIFYVDDLAALTVRLYGVSGKSIELFAENNDVRFSSLRQYTRP